MRKYYRFFRYVSFAAEDFVGYNLAFRPGAQAIKKAFPEMYSDNRI